MKTMGHNQADQSTSTYIQFFGPALVLNKVQSNITKNLQKDTLQKEFNFKRRRQKTISYKV